MPKSLAIVLNCAARDRRAAGQRSRLVDRLSAARVSADLFCAEDGESIGELARQVVARGYETVVAAGGDGTVNAVASAVAGSDVSMGVLPLGTINHFAKSVGIPREIEAAARTLVEGHAVRIDVGEVNGRLFVNNSTLGVHPDVIRYRDELRRRLRMNKWAAYAVATAAMIPRHEIPEVCLTVDGRERRLQTPFVFVGNNDYRLGDLDLGGRPEPGPGELGVGVAKTGGRLSTLRLLGAAALGRLDAMDDFDHFRARELRVDVAAQRMLIALDGEVVEAEGPLHYRSRPGALRVIARQSMEARAPAGRVGERVAQAAG